MAKVAVETNFFYPQEKTKNLHQENYAPNLLHANIPIDQHESKLQVKINCRKNFFDLTRQG